MNEFIWVEKYRPEKIRDCILPTRLRTQFQKILESGFIPNSIFEGTPGTGKTTTAIALCKELDVSYMFLNSSKERGMDVLRNEVVSFASSRALNGKSKVIILDEADWITPQAQAAFRGIPEMYSKNCTFILTCNVDSKIMDAIQSRMDKYSFRWKPDETMDLIAQYHYSLIKILKNEGIEYDEKTVAKLAKSVFPDFRKGVLELQRLAKIGKIDADTLKYFRVESNVDELFQFLKDKQFEKMRRWVVENQTTEITNLYRMIYDVAKKYLKPSSLPTAILIIAKYQYQHSFAADPEINLVACLTELMVECQYQ